MTTTTPTFSPGALKLARKQKGYTQTTLAATVGVDIQSVINWETGRKAPNPENLDKLAQLFGPVSTWPQPANERNR